MLIRPGLPLGSGGVSVTPPETKLAFSARRAVDRYELLLVRLTVEQRAPSDRVADDHAFTFDTAEHLLIV
jgi:hypothetical protein